MQRRKPSSATDSTKSASQRGAGSTGSLAPIAGAPWAVDRAQQFIRLEYRDSTRMLIGLTSPPPDRATFLSQTDAIAGTCRHTRLRMLYHSRMHLRPESAERRRAPQRGAERHIERKAGETNG